MLPPPHYPSADTRPRWCETFGFPFYSLDLIHGLRFVATFATLLRSNHLGGISFLSSDLFAIGLLLLFLATFLDQLVQCFAAILWTEQFAFVCRCWHRREDFGLRLYHGYVALENALLESFLFCIRIKDKVGRYRLVPVMRFLASGEKPRLEGKSGRSEPSSLARDDPRPTVRQSFDRRFDEQ
jgi:hypothetical protein